MPRVAAATWARASRVRKTTQVAYDTSLANRIRTVLSGRNVVEKKMFGGLAFMLDGHMCVGVIEKQLMVRVGPEKYDEALRDRFAREMDFTGRPLTGFVYVAPAGYRTEANLRKWVRRGETFVATLPFRSDSKDERSVSPRFTIARLRETSGR